jgi:hypothetical protein
MKNMKNRFFALLVVGLLILSALGAAFAQRNPAEGNRQNNRLAASLPASDAVMTFDAKRFMNDALPQILSSNQTLLGNVIGEIDQIKTKTGIDLRQFEQVAVGVAINKISAKEYDFEPLILARGQMNANALLSVAKVAAKGKYREEKIGGKSVFIFAAKEIAEQNKPATQSAQKARMIDRFIGKLTQEIAVTSFDANTLAFGTVARLRQAVEAKTRIGADVSGLLDRKQGSVMNFAAKLPGGMSAFLPLDNDELGKNIDAIQYLSGSMDVAGANTILQLTAKTERAEQAQGLAETLEGLQMVGKAIIGGMRGADKKVYARMIENAKFTRAANELTLDLQVPQSDIDVLIGAQK